MSTQAVPTPGTTSAANAYQTEFNSAYYLSKDPVFDPLFAGRPGSGNPSGTPLTQDQAWVVVGQLIKAGWIVDEEIDAEGMDPFTTMFMRQLYGQTWEPAGLGETQSTEVLTPGEYSGPVPNGAITVSTNIADFPINPKRVTAPAPPSPPPGKMANPIGRRLSFGSTIALGDNFGSLAGDGYNVGDTWAGTAQGFTGTWTKEAISLGMMIVWTKTA
jgi:hypothetical protein